MNAPEEPWGKDPSVARLRVPPHSIEAEQSVLGGLLFDGKAFGSISDIVTEADFYRHEHRLIFSAIAQLLAAGQPSDVVTVYEQLDGSTADFGGLKYINELAQCVPSANNIRGHAEIVAERATLRALIARADEIATSAFHPQGRTAAQILDESRVGFARIQEQRRVGGARRLPVLTGPELIEAAASLTWLCNGVIPAQSLGMIFGASGTFKSFLALDLALHVAHGLPWLGRRTEQGPALWIAAEGGKGFGHRVNAWHRSRRLRPSEQLVGIPAGIDLGTDAWRVVEAVQSSVGITPSIVVVDTLSQTYTAGGEENSASDMAAYLRELGARFRDLWKCAVLVVHHSGHTATERPRGSSAIQANTDYLIGCWRDEKQMLATLSCEHQKDGDRFEDAMFSLSKIDLGADKHGDRVTHLAARHLSDNDDIEQAMDGERKAGRVGKNQLILMLAQNGMKEADLRKAYADECDVSDPESRRRIYNRAKKWATEKGYFEIAQGVVITLKGGT